MTITKIWGLFFIFGVIVPLTFYFFEPAVAILGLMVAGFISCAIFIMTL